MSLISSQTLVELGGRGRREQVIELVGQKMQNVLRPADYEKLPQSSFIRWENRVAWQASNMRREGYIKNDSPRGIWEITDAGRKWLDDNS
jgi:restriction system protein